MFRYKKVGLLCCALLVLSSILPIALPVARATPAYRTTPSITGVHRHELLPNASLDLPYQDKSTSSELKQKVRSVVNQNIQPGMTNFEKAVTLHDWLVLNAQYDVSMKFKWRHYAEGVLLYGKGVCDGYAKAYKLLCDEVNIPCKVIIGRAGGGHAWNQIKLGSNWYHVDCTWDDPIGGNTNGPVSGFENRDYFGLTDNAIRFDHTSWKSSVKCTSIDYNFSYHEGYYDKLLDNYKREIKLELDKGNQTFKLEAPPWYYDHAACETIAHALRLQNYTLGNETIQLLVQYDSHLDIYTVQPKPIPITSISLSATTKTIKVGQTLALAVAINPANATNKGLTWKSSNKKLATIDGSGLLTAKKVGKVTITATATDGSKKKATFKITIKK